MKNEKEIREQIKDFDNQDNILCNKSPCNKLLLSLPFWLLVLLNQLLSFIIHLLSFDETPY